MVGHWIITYKGTASDGGSQGFYECSNCHKKASAMQFPRYFEDKDGKWHDPHYCPWCGSDNRERPEELEYKWRIAEVIIQNMQELIENYENAKKDGELEEVWWWQNEYGSDLTDMIDCHPVFADSDPCLNDVRNAEYGTDEYRENCKECKAKWLMGVWE